MSDRGLTWPEAMEFDRRQYASNVAERGKAKKKRAAAFKKLRTRNSVIRGARPERNPKYLAWIRTSPCIISNPNWLEMLLRCPPLATGITAPNWMTVTLQDSPTQACHVGKSGKGMRQKCSDYEVIPMSATFHREQHGPDGATFFERHPIPLNEVFEALRKAYEEQK